MGKLKPIGSEKLQGQDKLNRILEIARYKENIPQSVNEVHSNEYDVQLSDGLNYKIVREKSGYVIKKSINEGVDEYIEPMKNRKYYSSYSQAFKRLNLIAKEINGLYGNDSGTSLFGEQKKYTLKTPTSAAEPTPETPVPSTDLPEPDMGDEDMPTPDTSSEEMPTPDTGGEEMPTPDMEDTDTTSDMSGGEEVTMKSIQKLTGKLGQKIRQFTEENELTSNDAKYVINSILSAIDLNSLEPEDREEILSRFEAEEMGGEDMIGDEPDMGGEDMMSDTPEMGGEEVPSPEEVGEDFMIKKPMGKGVSMDMSEMEALGDKFSKKFKSAYAGSLSNALESNESKGVSKILDSVFAESKVDKIISKYFKLDEKEQQIIESKKRKKINEAEDKFLNLCETYKQEVSSKRLIEKFPEALFIGKSNKNNLLFQVEGANIKITPEGKII